MSLNTDPAFPPSGLPPYAINRNWCMGDTVSIFNNNFENFDSRIINLNTNLQQLSTQALPVFTPNITDTTEINILISPTGTISNTTRNTLNRLRDFYIKKTILPFYNNNETTYNNRVKVIDYPGGNTSDAERFLRVLLQNLGSSTATNIINICIQDKASPVYYSGTTAFNPSTPRTVLYNSDINNLRNALSVLNKPLYSEIIILNTGTDFQRDNFGEFVFTIQNGIEQYSSNFGLADYSNINSGQFNITYDEPVGVSATYYANTIKTILTRINNL